MHQCRRLQRVTRTFLLHVMSCQSAEFAINEWQQPSHGVCIARSEFKQKMSNIVGVLHCVSKILSKSVTLKMIADFLTARRGEFRLMASSV